jgi:Ca2+-dependent lipid-binding protein
LDDDGSGTIYLDEFIQNYFERQKVIKERIIQLEEDIKVHVESREKLISKLKDQRIKERLNAYGIDEDAILSVRIIEARDLTPMDITGKADPYCVLKFGGQTQKSNFIKQELNPVWNEVFTFDVESGKEVMEIEVFDKDDFGTDDFEG